MNASTMYRAEDIQRIQNEYGLVKEKYEHLLIRFTHRTYSNARAQEYGTQGFSRRLQTLRRCIKNVFTILPPDRTAKPTKDELSDATINIQAFVFNVFGSIDNLAWMWVLEKGLTIDRFEIGLRPKNALLRRSFSIEFQHYLGKFDEWFGYLENFRHALAHRIPLYIPPYMVPKSAADKYKQLDLQMTEAFARLDFDAYERLSEEQERLGVFQPLFTHSYAEKSRSVAFHAQLLADFNTVVELGQNLLLELDRVQSISNEKPVEAAPL